MDSKLLTPYLNYSQAKLQRNSFLSRKYTLEKFFRTYHQITEQTIAQFISDGRDKGMEPNSIQHHLGELARFLVYCRKHGLEDEEMDICIDFCRDFRPRSIMQPVATKENVQQLIAKAGSKPYAVIVALQAFVGLRVSEVLKLQRGDFNQDGTILIRSPKNGKDRLVTMPKGTWLDSSTYLQKALAELNPHDQLFSVKQNSYIVWLKRTTAKLGMEGITSHSFRRFFATYSQEVGIPIATLKEQLGHSSLQSTSHYLTVTKAMRKQVKDMFNQKNVNQQDNE